MDPDVLKRVLYRYSLDASYKPRYETRLRRANITYSLFVLLARADIASLETIRDTFKKSKKSKKLKMKRKPLADIGEMIRLLQMKQPRRLDLVRYHDKNAIYDLIEKIIVQEDVKDRFRLVIEILYHAKYIITETYRLLTLRHLERMFFGTNIDGEQAIALYFVTLKDEHNLWSEMLEYICTYFGKVVGSKDASIRMNKLIMIINNQCEKKDRLHRKVENVFELLVYYFSREETYLYLHRIVMIDPKVNSLRFVENGVSYGRDDYQEETDRNLAEQVNLKYEDGEASGVPRNMEDLFEMIVGTTHETKNLFIRIVEDAKKIDLQYGVVLTRWQRFKLQEIINNFYVLGENLSQIDDPIILEPIKNIYCKCTNPKKTHYFNHSTIAKIYKSKLKRNTCPIDTFPLDNTLYRQDLTLEPLEESG